MSSEEVLPDKQLLAAFEEHREFLELQNRFLAIDLLKEPSPAEKDSEYNLHQSLSNILLKYQEQSYLLDPVLDSLVVPVVEKLKSYAKDFVDYPTRCRGSSGRVHLLTLHLFAYIRFRGYKTITRFFPHEIADLSIATGFMLSPDGYVQEPFQWALRYEVLLWLGLICMIPFDLAQFDEETGSNKTATTIEQIGKDQLSKAGLERDASALLLARLYMRKDTAGQFDAFIQDAFSLKSDTDPIQFLGILHVLCEVAKGGPSQMIQSNVDNFLSIADIAERNQAFSANTIIRKYRAKLVARTALRVLPGRPSRALRRGPTLSGAPSVDTTTAAEDQIEVPEEVETVLEQLFQCLQDRDTIVRWSAAKGVARIAERLPTDFSDQVLETIVGLFEIHSVVAARMYDLPSAAESTWHGACLGCAELARRGLVATHRLSELIGWLSKSLYFDLRKGAHSIGSNVRDATAYVLWALARTTAPSDLAPHAEDLARNLVTVALYDREIHIRRAASAAFQEYVGRTSLFPHGIDVLRETDFYAVSVKKNSFLIAAPQVAEHVEYRGYLFHHVLNVTLRHWDATMRELGAQSLKLVCLHDIDNLAPEAIRRAATLIESVDLADVHGGLLALTEVATAFHSRSDKEGRLRDFFRHLAKLPRKLLEAPRNDIVSAAACDFIANTITVSEIDLEDKSSVPAWRDVLDHGLKHRNQSVQESAARALSSVSKLVDCSHIVARLIRELKTGSPAMQQSLGRILGVIDYDRYPGGLMQSVNSLIECVEPSPKSLKNVEARRNCFLAMPQILENVIQHLYERLQPEAVQSLYDCLLAGLEDYTHDERGDVGSWIRLACIRGLTRFCELLISHSNTAADCEVYLSNSKYHAAVAGILKQGVERLDNVRGEAGECFIRLLNLRTSWSGGWTPHGAPHFRQLLQEGTTDTGRWNDASWLFPKAVRFLEVEEYRPPVLKGLVVSLGSKTDSTHRPLAGSLTSYIQSLPVKSDEGYDLLTYSVELTQYAKSNLTNNAVVVPVLQTFNVLLESGALSRLPENDQGHKCLQILHGIASRGVQRLKSVQRILESMKVVVNMLPLESMYDTAVPSLANFLAHPYPTVRAATAEYLYLAVQNLVFDEGTEELEKPLLQTEWNAADSNIAASGAQQVVDSLQSHKPDF